MSKIKQFKPELEDIENKHTKTIPLGFTFFPNDFLLDTMTWPSDCVGIYTRMLCLQWTNGFVVVKNDIPQGLPNNDENISYDTNDTKEEDPIIEAAKRKRLKQVWGYIKHKFIEVENKPNCWMNKKLNTQRLKKIRISEKNSDNGRIGANKRWGNNKPPKRQKTKELSPISSTTTNLQWFTAEVEKNKHLCANEQLLQEYIKYYLNIQPDGKTYYFETIKNFSIERTIKNFTMPTNKSLKNESNKRHNTKRTKQAAIAGKQITKKPAGTFTKPQQRAFNQRGNGTNNN